MNNKVDGYGKCYTGNQILIDLPYN